MAKETYTIERVDNGWKTQYVTSKGIERNEVYEDGDFFNDRGMQVKESLHIVLYNVFQDYMDDNANGGLAVDLVEPAPEEEGSKNETQEDGSDNAESAT